jgi:hypothetical protein
MIVMTTLKATLRSFEQGRGGARPLQQLPATAVFELCDLAASQPHLHYDVLFHAWAELVDQRQSGRALKAQLEDRFAAAGTRSETWLGDAMRAVQSVQRTTTGKHHVYVLVCNGYGDDRKGLGLYVGETKWRPERRFDQHASGLRSNKAARDFLLDRVGGRRVPLGLLPSFHAHLNPVSRDEAKQLEVALVQALLAAKVPAERVGGPRVLKAKTAQDEHDDPDAS